MHEPVARNGNEARRLQAWERMQRGWLQRQIADAMGVSKERMEDGRRWASFIGDLLVDGSV
jgi:hypothetical protein